MRADGFYGRLKKTLRAIEDAEGEKPNGLEIVRRVEARGLRIGKSSVQRYLNEEGLPLIDSLEALASGLGVSPGWLAFGQGGEDVVMEGTPVFPEQPPGERYIPPKKKVANPRRRSG